MVVRIVVAIVAQGGFLTIDGDQLRCQLPAGTRLPDDLAAEITVHKAAILAALQGYSMEATVARILGLTPPDREMYRAELALDLAAWAAAEAQDDTTSSTAVEAGQ